MAKRKKQGCLPVVGFPDYQVGDDGSVWTRKSPSGCGPFIPWRRMNPWPNQRGYLCVTITNGQQRLAARVHILVLSAFVGPRPTGLYGLHRDDDKRNNHLDNLRWGTAKENGRDAVRNGRQAAGERHGCHKLTDVQVREIRAMPRCRIRYRDVAASFGVSQAAVKAIRQGERWKHILEAS